MTQTKAAINDNLTGIDWPLVVQGISSFATSESAHKLISEISPLKSVNAAQKSFSDIIEACEILRQGQRPFMESLDLYHHWSTRLSKQSILKTLELKDLRFFCVETLALKEFVQDFDNDWAIEIQHRIFNVEEPLSAIDQVILGDGSIRTDASEKLHKLFQEKKSLSNKVQKNLDRIVKDNELDVVLQDKFVTNREGRWVIPVKSGMQHSFEGIIHAASVTKQTVFMEPQEIVPLNNRIRDIENEITEEVERILSDLSGYLYTRYHELKEAYNCMLETDVIFAKANWALRTDGQSIKFSENTCELKELKNPLLCLGAEKVIPNDLSLDTDKRILLLSGPNAGGKTVLLKSLGLAAHMARCGLLVSAHPSSEIPFFENIVISVGDEQSIDENLSTFAAHLKKLGQCLNYKGSKQLILIDEICSSTDPEEGSALARSFITSYADNQVFGLVTSHFGHLKSGWEQGCGVTNGSLEFAADRGPTYQFYMGIPGQSLAIQTAKRVGVNQAVIERALDYLGPEKRKYQSDLAQLNEVKAQLEQAKKDYSKKRDEADKQKEKYEKLIAEFNREKDKRLTQSLIKAERKIEKEIKLAKADQVFKKHTELQKIKHELPTIVKSKPGKNKVFETADDFAASYPPGSKVFVQSLNQDGIVQSEPNKKGEVLVLSRSMRLSIHWKDLKPAQFQANPTKDILQKRTSVSFSPADQLRTVDLRGKKVEDAIAEIEIQLDKAALQQEARVKIVHGHGTETLKKVVRNYLTRCVYVKTWKAGSAHSGGDGVTWVEIN